MNDVADPRIGRVLQDRYRIVSQIAAGSMGVVYRGERLKLGRSVAIKFLQATSADLKDFTRRFELEARALSRLAHPNCVSIFDFGVDDAPYLVMEFVHGLTMSDLLTRGAMPAPRAIGITRQILAALAHAHGQGIVHRDVKPGNIMLTEATGTGDHIRILDFGLAKIQSAALSLGGPGSSPMVIGTPSYMSPEQARADEDADLRSDLYSVGILLFEMLVGKKPFDDDDMFTVLQMQQQSAPPRLRRLAGGEHLSRQLEAVVLKALQKQPDARYQTALEFSAAVIGTPEATQSPLLIHASTAEIVPPPMSSSRIWLILGIVGLLGAVGVAAWMFSRARGGDPPARESPPSVQRKHSPVLDSAPTSNPSIDATAVDAAIDAPADTALPDAGEDGALADASDENQPADTSSGPTRLERLLKLKQRYPDRASLAYAIGREYARKRWWRNALGYYRAVLQKEPRYGRRRSLCRDLVTAMADRRAAPLAERLLLKVGRSAIPHLRKATRHPSQNVRKRAARLLGRLGAKK